MSRRENWLDASAEGATAPETLRPKDRCGSEALESDTPAVSAEGIAISGTKTEGAFIRGLPGRETDADALLTRKTGVAPEAA